MFSNFYFVLIAVVVIIICILIWRYAREGPSIDETIRKSAGVYDQHARAALDHLRRVRQPTPRQRIQRARLIQFNVLDNNQAHPMMQEARVQVHAAVVGGADPADIDLIDMEMARALEQVFGLHLAQARAQSADTRAREIAQQAPTRAKAVEQALAVTVADDSQNVHEPKVTQHGRNTYSMIEGDFDKDAWAESLHRWVDAHPRGKLMQPCVDTMMRGDHISTYNTNEDDILIATWHRIHDARNRENIDNLKDALADALVDASQPMLVCANGRCARVLASLTLLDFDPDAGSMMTLSAYRADIMRECSEAFDKALARAETSLPSVHASYNGGPDPTDDEQAKFHAQLREIITEAIDKHREHLTPDEQKQIQAECEIYMAL
jgi:hypothetical protein